MAAMTEKEAMVDPFLVEALQNPRHRLTKMVCLSCILSSDISRQTAVKRWKSFSRDVFTIPVSMILRNILLHWTRSSRSMRVEDSRTAFFLSFNPSKYLCRRGEKCTSSASSVSGWTRVIFSEDFSTEGHGGYFDHYGMIRDIMQNHLLQILALQVKVLRSMRPIQLEDVVIGKYKSTTKGGVTYPGYTDDKTVPKDSLTPTFAAAALFIDNARWDGVPFLKYIKKNNLEMGVLF